MAFDDMTAFGAIRALNRGGVRVPDDCSVIGFDDVAASALCTPPLTTIRQPMEAMGADAVGIVLDGIHCVLEKREVAANHRKVAPGVGGPGVHPEPAVGSWFWAEGPLLGALFS